MYRVLLVDDEENAIKSLQLSVPWAQLNLTVSATAQSAQEAFSLLHRLQIDIIVTDICMPDIDGLSLCAQLLAEDARLQVIVVSGFAEFAYAKKCIDMGVKGYCLKPIETSEMMMCLNQSILALDRIENVLQEDFVNSLEMQDTPAMCHYLQTHGLSAEHYFTAVSIGSPTAFMLTQNVVSVRLGKTIFAYFCDAPIRFSTEEIFSDSDIIYGIGMCENACSCSGFKNNVSHCMICAYQFFITGTSGIWNNVPDYFGKKIVTELTSYLHHNNMEQFIELLQSIAVRNRNQMFNVNSAYSLYNTVLALPEMEEYSGDLSFYSFGQLVAEYGTFRNMLKKLIMMLSESGGTQDTSSASPAVILTVLQYINANYAKDISLQTMADEIHLNRNYIGQLFKREIGYSYSKYLTELRVQKAKEMLLRSDLQIADVCDATGFNDYFYFIKVFKKETGCTPSQFRNHSNDTL